MSKLNFNFSKIPYLFNKELNAEHDEEYFNDEDDMNDLLMRKHPRGDDFEWIKEEEELLKQLGKNIFLIKIREEENLRKKIFNSIFTYLKPICKFIQSSF